MGQGENVFFNFVTVIFLVLTLLVGFAVLSIASGSMDPPIFAPDEDEPLPTQAPRLTLTPSPVPGADMVPAETPVPDSQ